MTIKWNSPIDDGGMPITAYTVEAKTQGGEWQIWECLDTPERSAIMQKLQKGQEYQFRVIAINKAGKSEPSFPSRPKVAKETDCKYLKKIENNAKNVICKCFPLLMPSV